MKLCYVYDINGKFLYLSSSGGGKFCLKPMVGEKDKLFITTPENWDSLCKVYMSIKENPSQTNKTISDYGSIHIPEIDLDSIKDLQLTRIFPRSNFYHMNSLEDKKSFISKLRDLESRIEEYFKTKIDSTIIAKDNKYMGFTLLKNEIKVYSIGNPVSDLYTEHVRHTFLVPLKEFIEEGGELVDLKVEEFKKKEKALTDRYQQDLADLKKLYKFEV